MTLGKKWLKWSFLGLGCLLILSCCSGQDFVFQSIYYLAAGWVYFLKRKLPQIDLHSEALVTGLLALAALLLATHLLMRTFCNRPANGESAAYEWRLRRTFAIVGVVVLTFCAGISAVGITHQSIWLFSSKEPLVRKEPYQNFLRGAAPRTKSNNNLRQMGLGMQIFDEHEKKLPKLGLNRSAYGFGSHLKSGVTQFAMGDGSVRSFRDDADPEFLVLLANPGKE